MKKSKFIPRLQIQLKWFNFKEECTSAISVKNFSGFCKRSEEESMKFSAKNASAFFQ